MNIRPTNVALSPGSTSCRPNGTRPASVASGSVEFLAAEIAALGDQLAQVSGRSPTDEQLTGCIDQEAAADAFLGQLWGVRAAVDCSDRDFYRLVRSREYLPAEAFISLAGGVLSGLVVAKGGRLSLLRNQSTCRSTHSVHLRHRLLRRRY